VDDRDDPGPDDDSREDPAEPTGSCDLCGSNLYPGDDWDGLCNGCAWSVEQNRGGEQSGWQPLV
jgi:hypothetical protein